MLEYIFGLALCASILFFASKVVYGQVVRISEILRIPAFLISLLLVAFSTSIPELFIGVVSATQGEPSFSLGDILGSNIVNLTFIAGLVLLLGRKKFALKQYISRKQLAFIFVIASAPVFLLLDGTLSQVDGVLLLGLYVLYVMYVVFTQYKKEAGNEKHKKGLLKSLGLFLLGIVLLVGASEGIIHLASSLSAGLHIAPFIIGVFAIAFSTSLPELIYGMRVALARKPELSLADLAGSSAVNATAILGTVAIINPITPVVLSSVLTTGFFGVAVSLLFFLIVSRKQISYIQGAILLILYLVFVSFNFLT